MISYIGAGQAALLTFAMIASGKAQVAPVFAIGCVFLIYWGRRVDREEGDR